MLVVVVLVVVEQADVPFTESPHESGGAAGGVQLQAAEQPYTSRSQWFGSVCTFQLHWHCPHVGATVVVVGQGVVVVVVLVVVVPQLVEAVWPLKVPLKSGLAQ